MENYSLPLCENNATSYVTNYNCSSAAGESPDKTSDQWVLLAISIVVFVGSTGNLAVLYVIFTVKKFRVSGNFMLANLSFASLLAMCSTVTTLLQYRPKPLIPFSTGLCWVLPGLLCPAEGFTMVCLSLERTRSARRPFEGESRKAAVGKILLIWLASVALEMPKGFLFWAYDEQKSLFKCVNQKQLNGEQWQYVAYIVVYFVIVSVVPCGLLVKNVHRMVDQFKILLITQVSTVGRKYHRYRLKLLRNALIFTGLFILTKIPSAGYWLLLNLPPELVPATAYSWIRSWRRIYYAFATLNMIFFPLIVFALSTELQKHVICKGPRPARV